MILKVFEGLEFSPNFVLIPGVCFIYMSRGHRKDDFAAARSHLHQGLGKNFDFGSITVDSVDRFCMGPLHVTFACLCILLREMSESQRVSTRSSSCSVHSLHLFADAHTHTGPGKFYKGVGSIW